VSKLHYCGICGTEFDTYLETVEHILEKHNIPNSVRKQFERELAKQDWTCEDCIYCSVIIAPLNEAKPMKKYCPLGFLFDHPNPRKCPRFIPSE